MELYWSKKAKMMKKKYRVNLTDGEREELKRIKDNRSSKSPVVKRAYILLAADESGEKRWNDQQIHEAYDVSVRSVERLRERFVLEGFEIALKGKKREIFKEKILTGEVEAKLISLRCSGAPKGYARWTLHLLADKMIELNYVERISHESVRQILKKMK
jgi:hypothetical protein